MHLRAALRKIVPLVCSIAVAACSTTASTTGSTTAATNKLTNDRMPVTWAPPAGAAPPPLVIRIGSGGLGGEGVPGAAGEFLKPAGAGVFFGLLMAPLTFGMSLIYVPAGIAAGVEGASHASECAERWKALFGDARSGIASQFSQSAVSQQLASEIQRMTQGPEPAVSIEAFPGGAAGGPEAIGEQRSATSIVLVDVDFRMEFSRKMDHWPDSSSPRCDFTFKTMAHLTSERLSDRKVLGERRFSSALVVDIAPWAGDPAAASAWLDRHLALTAEQIVLAYPWLAATELLSRQGPEGGRAYCSISPPGETEVIACMYSSLEQCQDEMAQTHGECVPRTAAVPRWCFLKSPDATAWSYTADCTTLDRRLEPGDAAKVMSDLERRPAGAASSETPRWCLVDSQAKLVRCDLDDYESCASAKPDQGHRCVMW